MKWKATNNIDKIQRTSGVYVLYSADKKLKYVGYSHDIFERLLKHEVVWSYVKVKYLSVDKAKQLEYKLIKKLKPRYNTRHKNKALSTKHRMRLKPHTYYTLKIAGDFANKRPADILEELVLASDLPMIVKSRIISNKMIEEFYED